MGRFYPSRGQKRVFRDLRVEIVENYGSGAHARVLSEQGYIFFKGTSSIDYAIKAHDGILSWSVITRLLHYIQAHDSWTPRGRTN